MFVRNIRQIKGALFLIEHTVVSVSGATLIEGMRKNSKFYLIPRIIVFTDGDFLSNAYIKQYSNAQVGLNIINWLSELDYQVIAGHTEDKVERLDLTSKQRIMIAAILFLIPMFIVLCGIFVLRQRTSTFKSVSNLLPI